jgi:hypothetical protein
MTDNQAQLWFTPKRVRHRFRPLLPPEVLIFHVHKPASPTDRLPVGTPDAALAVRRKGVSQTLGGIRTDDLYCVRPRRRGVTPPRGELARASRLPRDVAQHDSKWVAMVEGRRILPTFAEGVSDVANRRSAYLEVNAVPRRSITVSGFEIDRLRVAFVTAVVVAAMTQVDPADERHVVIRSGSVAHHDELLVMASAATDALVEKHLTTGFVDLANEPGVLLLEEVRPTRV